MTGLASGSTDTVEMEGLGFDAYQTTAYTNFRDMTLQRDVSSDDEFINLLEADMLVSEVMPVC